MARSASTAHQRLKHRDGAFSDCDLGLSMQHISFEPAEKRIEAINRTGLAGGFHIVLLWIVAEASLSLSTSRAITLYGRRSVIPDWCYAGVVFVNFSITVETVPGHRTKRSAGYLENARELALDVAAERSGLEPARVEVMRYHRSAGDDPFGLERNVNLDASVALEFFA